MAMGMLVMMLVGNSFPRAPYWGSAPPSNVLATAVLHHPTYWANYYAVAQENGRNLLRGDTLGWTNDGNALSSPAPVSDTNSSRP